MIKDFYDIKDLRVVIYRDENKISLLNYDDVKTGRTKKIFYVDNKNGMLVDLVGYDCENYSFRYDNNCTIPENYLTEFEIRSGKIKIDRIVEIYNIMNGTNEERRIHNLNAKTKFATVFYDDYLTFGLVGINRICQIFKVCDGVYIDFFRDSVIPKIYNDGKIPSFNFSYFNFRKSYKMSNAELLEIYKKRNKEILDYIASISSSQSSQKGIREKIVSITRGFFRDSEQLRKREKNGKRKVRRKDRRDLV